MTITRKGTPEWRVHPGEILREEFLKPMNLTVYQLAKELHVPAPRLNDVVLRKRGVSADTAIRLARFFGTSEQFWLGLQAAYEVSMAKEALRNEIDQIKPWQADDRTSRA
jgi:addiction module HigA family antidote